MFQAMRTWQPRLENNMSRFNLPAAESPLNAGPTRFLVDTHESRSAAKETVASCASYIVPGLLLLILSRYLSQIYFWAYICVALLCLGFVAIYVTDLIAMQGVWPFRYFSSRCLLKRCFVQQRSICLRCA